MDYPAVASARGPTDVRAFDMPQNDLKNLVDAVTRQVLGSLSSPNSKETLPTRSNASVRPLVAANWKMNGCTGGMEAYAAEMAGAPCEQVETVLIPPAVLIGELATALQQAGATKVLLGVQNIHWQASGACTGELSASLVQAVGARWTLVGHSERRQAGEQDEQVSKKLTAALSAGLSVLLCVGEQLAERKLGATCPILRRQVMTALAATRQQPLEPLRLAIAYEPVWAIGTGQVASPDQIAEAMAFIHGLVNEIYGQQIGPDVRVLYGGSVSAKSAPDIFSVAGVDGVLVGGASLEGSSFRKIVQAASARQVG